ncbi:type IV pilus secretin PilQ [Neisseriaceae bacterium B1]
MKTTNSVKALSAIAFGLLLQAASAGNITDINVSVLPDKQRVVKVRFDKDVVEPSGFITATPARIALDFPSTDVNLQQPNLTFNDTLLSQVVAAQGNNHARILLSLSKEGQYNTQIKGNEVWIYVSEASATNSAPIATNSKSEVAQRSTYTPSSQPSQGTPSFNIDFHKGSNNAGVIEFASGYAGDVQVKRQSDRLVLTLKNYALSTQDQRNLDVTDFSTPVRTIGVKRLGNNTQITIRTQGSWGYKMTGNGGNKTITIQPEKNIASLGVTGKKANTNFSGKTISLDFQNVDVRTILQIIAKEANTNIVASDSVQGKMTLSLKDVPWDQALSLVLDARDLDMKRIGNIINVAPREEMLKKTKSELESRTQIEELGPLLSQTFQLKYKNVEEFKEILKLDQSSSSGNNNSRSILSSRGSALIDPSTNTLIITDNEFVMRKFEKLVEELDVPARQVMVEARIVEAADGVARDLGVKFGAFDKRSTGDGRRNTTWGGGYGSGNGIYGGINSPSINLPVVTSATGGAISLLRSTATGALGLELTALETDNRSKTISTPRVLTQDRKEAEIKQGIQIPYTTRSSDGATETEFKDAVMSLKVTPRITPDNRVILDIAINKDEPDYGNVNVEGEPGISTKSVTTQAMIEDGGTLVVGGIYQETMRNNLTKVPLLGDIPVLGNLFKSRSRSNTRNELLFFITPRIMGSEASVLRY